MVQREPKAAMWPRLILILAILVLMVVTVFHDDAVHSDPGFPIEDAPYIASAMALVSYFLFRPTHWGHREAAPVIVFISLALGLWIWAHDQYRRVGTVQSAHVSLVFPGLYFPRDSLRYTFTALAVTNLPEDEVGRALLGKLKERGVPVADLRIHFVPKSSPP